MSGEEQTSESNSMAPIRATVAPPAFVFNPVNQPLLIVEETAEEPYRLRSPSESSYLAASEVAVTHYDRFRQLKTFPGSSTVRETFLGHYRCETEFPQT